MHLPGPLRAAVGLVASAADEAKRLPDRAFELPMLAVSTALQASVRAQQRYARLTARGDEVLHRTRPTDEPPAWARFDEPVAADELGHGAEQPATEQQAAAPGAPSQKSATQKPATQKPAAKRTTGRKSTAKKAAPAQPPAAKAPAQPDVEKGTSEQPPSANGKVIKKPRHTAPSRFDDAADD